MKNQSLFFVSPLLLLISVLFSNYSGNDKSPIFILLVLGMIVLIFIVSGIVTLFGYANNLKSVFWGALTTLIYVISVILLSRVGIIDSQILLGFR